MMNETSQTSGEKFDEVIINAIFSKHYKIIKQGNYTLPSPDTWFTSPAWQDKKLQELKKELNDVKSKLNNYNYDIWHQHTNNRNKAGAVQRTLQQYIKPEFLTQAWCKFYENASSFPIVPDIVRTTNNLSSVHICEAPGAFISSLNHWLKINIPEVKWDWLACSLNPYYEGNSLSQAISDDRVIIHTLDHWYFGVDDTGNIMNLDNVEALSKLTQNKHNVLLVTADGSINCIENPGEQEIIVSHLHFCEAFTALRILNTGGSLVLKIFTTFEHQTICLIYLLLCCFEELHVNKPATSKEGNSETYLNCLGFKGWPFIQPYMDKLRNHFNLQYDRAMFSRDDLPTSFIKNLISCSQFFKEHQCTVILDNIKTFNPDRLYKDLQMKHIKHLIAVEYIRRCNLKMLDFENEKLIPNIKNSKIKGLNSSKKKISAESFNDICKKKSLDSYKRLLCLLEDVKSVYVKKKCSELKFAEDLCELSINEGISYNKILNSKFCYSDMLSKLQEFLEITEKLDLKVTVPSDANIELYKEEMVDYDCSIYTIIKFNYKFEQNNLDTLKKIFNVINNMKSQCIILVGYCLLSRFNVGLLYILAHTFDSLELNFSKTLGCVIILKGNKNVPSVLQKMNDIFHALENSTKHNFTVLSVVPISLLCDNYFYPVIIESNIWIIKYYITYTMRLKTRKLQKILELCNSENY